MLHRCLLSPLTGVGLAAVPMLGFPSIQARANCRARVRGVTLACDITAVRSTAE